MTFEQMFGRSQKNPVLKQIFDRYADDTITDEQLKRVLAPVEGMINAGKFDRFSTRLRIFKPFLVFVAVAAIVFLAAFMQTGGDLSRYVTIPEGEIPLFGISSGGNTLSGWVYTQDGSGVSGIELYLTNASTGEIIEAAITDADGAYSFRNFAYGTYKLSAILPDGFEITDDSRAGSFISIGNETEFTFSESDTKKMEDMNIQLWRIN